MVVCAAATAQWITRVAGLSETGEAVALLSRVFAFVYLVGALTLAGDCFLLLLIASDCF